MVNLTQILIGFVLSVVASIISAFVTVRLSLNQFRSQRWWEKKAERYSQIIEHLSHLEFSLGEWLEEYEGVSRLGDVVIRYIIMSVLLVFLLIAPVNIASAQSPADHPEYASIVRIVVTDGVFKSVEAGTGFFVSPDGLALTASHVIYKAFKDPEHTHLLALWSNQQGERVYFKVQLVCATELPYDATRSPRDVPFSKDVAVARIVPVPHGVGWHKTWGYSLPGGYRYDWTAQDSLPTFTPLTLAAHGPQSGQHVRVPGYDHVSALPPLFEAIGEVGQSRSMRDGTPVFDIHSTQPNQPGGSGSPILAEDGTVVGMYPWRDNTDHSLGYGESVDVLRHPCGEVRL